MRDRYDPLIDNIFICRVRLLLDNKNQKKYHESAASQSARDIFITSTFY